MTATTALTGDLFDTQERARILGLQYAASAAVGMCFPVLAGALALVNWRLTFMLYLIAAVLIVPAARLPDRPLTAPRPGCKASNFDLRPTLGICALIGFWDLDPLAFDNPTRFSSRGDRTHFSGVCWACIGHPVSHGHPNRDAVRARETAFRSIAAMAFALMGIGYGVISIAARVPLV
jgi:hypothetical protein